MSDENKREFRSVTARLAADPDGQTYVVRMWVTDGEPAFIEMNGVQYTRTDSGDFVAEDGGVAHLCSSIRPR